MKIIISNTEFTRLQITLESINSGMCKEFLAKLKDTHAIIEAAPHAGNGNILTPVVKVDQVDTELAPITINSNTLAVECVNGSSTEAAKINVELQWGSF